MNLVQNGGVRDILSGNSSSNSSLFRSMSLPARRRVASKVYYDNILSGHARLRLKDIPMALEVRQYQQHDKQILM